MRWKRNRDTLKGMRVWAAPGQELEPRAHPSIVVGKGGAA